MIAAPSLSALPGIRHAFFTRKGGVSSGFYESLNGGVGSKDRPGDVAENRARMAGALAVDPSQFITAYQIHSPHVVAVDRAWTAETRPKADAIVTRCHGLAIGVTTADCGPVLFADAVAGVIGAAHAGWRGALTGVIEATLEAMETLGARRGDIVTALGPMIRQDHYEVGPEFVDAFLKADAGNARFFRDSGKFGHAQFHLPGYIARRLEDSGITRIEDLDLCTYADPVRFFSYRRSQHLAEADYGRHVNAIVLAD